MKIFSKNAVFFLMISMLSVFFVQTSFGSDEQQADQQAQKVSNESRISNGEELGEDWWLKNAKKYAPLPRPLLYHFEGSYAYSEQGGNVDAKKHKGEAELTLRKNLFTGITTYTIGKTETTINLLEKNTSLDNQSFRQALRYAITDRMSAAAGISWERNETKYLKDRFVYFGGLRAMIVDMPKLDIMVGGFYSYTDTSYLNENIQEIKKYAKFPSQEDYRSDALYFSQKLRWKITDKISFSERADYMMFLDDTEYYFWKLDLSLNFKLTKSVSFFSSYSVNYDNNSFVESVQDYLAAVEASGTGAGKMETTDTSLNIGIRFEF